MSKGEKYLVPSKSPRKSSIWDISYPLYCVTLLTCQKFWFGVWTQHNCNVAFSYSWRILPFKEGHLVIQNSSPIFPEINIFLFSFPFCASTQHHLKVVSFSLIGQMHLFENDYVYAFTWGSVSVLQNILLSRASNEGA